MSETRRLRKLDPTNDGTTHWPTCWQDHDLCAIATVERLTQRAEAAEARERALEKALLQFRDDKGHFCFNATPCDANWHGAKSGANCSPWCRKARAALAQSRAEGEG